MQQQQQQQPVVVVVLIGGGPYAELTAMHMVMRRLRVRPLFLTTQVMTGSQLVAAFLPEGVQRAMDAAEVVMATLRSTSRGGASAGR